MTIPAQLGLGELIQRLAAEPRGKKLRVGFADPCSYRGFYEELAFCYAEDVTVGEMLDAARGAVGATFEGYKGGLYTMGEHSPVWLVADAGFGGETLGAVLLDALLNDVALPTPRMEEPAPDLSAVPTDNGELANQIEQWAEFRSRWDAPPPRRWIEDLAEHLGSTIIGPLAVALEQVSAPTWAERDALVAEVERLHQEQDTQR